MSVSDPIIAQLPQLEIMLKAIEAAQFDSLFDHFAALDQAFGILYGSYLDELQYLAVGEPNNAVSEKMGEQFEKIRPLISTLREDLSLNEFNDAANTLTELRDKTTELYGLFSEFREASLQGDRYSELPYTHELLRVCHHYLKGNLSIDAVQGRLEVFCQFHEGFDARMNSLTPSAPERETYEKNYEDLTEALTVQLQGIEDLDHALEQNDKEAITEAMEMLRDAAEILVDIYRSLQKADLEPKTILCIRCGAENSTDARICGKCSAVLPQSAGAEASHSTITYEEDGSTVGHEDPEEIINLQRAVDQLLKTGEATALLEAINKQRKKISRCQQQFERMDKAPADLPEEHRNLLNQARALFQEGIRALELGSETLDQAASVIDPILLEQGMDEVRHSVDIFVEFQQRFREAEGMSRA